MSLLHQIRSTNSYPLLSSYRSAMRVGAVLLSVWLLSFFLLSGTYWSRVSPLSHVLDLEQGFQHYIYVVFLAVFTVGVCLSYIKMARSTDLGIQLWFLLICWLGVTLLVALQWRWDISLGNNAAVLLTAYSTGLLVARLDKHFKLSNAVPVILASVQAANILYYQHQGITNTYLGARDHAGDPSSSQGIAALAGIALPWALALVIGAKRQITSFLWTVCTSVLFAALIRTLEWWSIFAVTCGLTWAVWRLVEKKHWVLIGGFVLIASMAGMIYVHQTSMWSAAVPESERRSVILKRGVAIFRHNVLIGVGVGALDIPTVVSLHPADDENDIRAGYEDVGRTIIEEPKMLILHWLDELGIAGGVLFVLFCITIIRIIRKNRSVFATGIGASWLFIFIAGLFDTPFGLIESYYGNVLIGILLGITITLSSIGGEEQTDRSCIGAIAAQV